MKKLVGKILLTGISIMILTSCFDDDELPNFAFEEDSPEVLDEITVEELAEITAPLDGIFGNESGARSEGKSIDEITGLLEEFMEGSEVLEVSEGEDRGLQVWEFEILLSNGAIMEIVIVPELSKVLMVEGNDGPYEYTIEFGDTFISLENAFDIALDAVESGEILRWELELEEENIWEFEVIIENDFGIFEVEVKAVDGTVLKIKTEEDELNDDSEAPEDILEQVSAMTDGEIIHSELDESDKGNIWKIIVQTESVHRLWFLFTEVGEHFLTEGEGGPLGYQFDPGEEYLSLAETGQKMSEEFGPIPYKEWSYRQGEDGEWKYHFHFPKDGYEYFVVMNATSGDLEIIEKHGDDHLGEVEVTDEMREIVAGYFEGDITEAYRVHEGDSDLLYFKVVNDAGAVVKIGLDAESLGLKYVTGLEGPFDYDFNPGEDYISLSEALEAANNHSEGELEEWKFKIHDGAWYRIDLETADGKIGIWINAVSGEVVEVEDRENVDLPAELLEQVKTYFDGDLIDLHVESDGDYWYLKFGFDDSKIEMKLSGEGEIIKVNGFEGNLDYEVLFGDDYISFTEAIAIAAEATDGMIVSWEFEKTDDGYVFQFTAKVDGEDVYIHVDAITGDLKD